MALFIPALIPALDANGNPINGATWNFYRAGTLTAATVYSDATNTTSLGSQETANAAGRFVSIYLDDAESYRAILKDAGGTTIQDIDPYTGYASSAYSVSPETFGALGDGETNDHDALADMAAFVEAAGGGIVTFRQGATYVWGKQTAGTGGRYLFGENAIEISGCESVILNMNGATLKLASGFKYGSFDPGSGLPLETITTDISKSASLGSAVQIENCGTVRIIGGIWDMNSQGQVIGGEYGDVDRQLECYPIALTSNRNTVIEDVWIKDSCLDGISVQNQIDNEDDVDMPIVFRRVRIENVARNCYSINGGKNFRWEQCYSDHGGGAANSGVDGGKFASDPASACNVENHNESLVRDLTTVSSTFKAGAGSDTCWAWGGGDSRKARHIGSTFDGNIFGGIKDEEFDNCTLNGAFGSILGGQDDPNDNTRVINSVCSDVASAQDLSSVQQFLNSAGSGADVTFRDSTLVLTHKRLTIGGYDFTENDVYIRYDDGATGVPAGGTNIIATDTNTDLTGTKFHDEHVGAGPATAWYIGTGTGTRLSRSSILPSNSTSLFWQAATVGSGGGAGNFSSGPNQVGEVSFSYSIDGAVFNDGKAGTSLKMQMSDTAPTTAGESGKYLVWKSGAGSNDILCWRKTSGGTYAAIRGIERQAAIANIGGSPSQADFNGLLAMLRTAGIIAT